MHDEPIVKGTTVWCSPHIPPGPAETDKENGRANSISKVGRIECEPEWEDG